MSRSVSPVVVALAVLLVLAGTAAATTLEKLTLDEMTQKATLIVRGRVSSCGGETRGSLIYTRCRVTVSERWKGTAGSEVYVFVPGGTAGGLTQIFTGTPRLGLNEEYVLFLWSGRANMNQVIGLSQGVFDLKLDSKGQPVVRREASSEIMLGKSGQQIQDSPVEMGVAELRNRVNRALAAGVKE